MKNTLIIPKKEEQELEIKYPKITLKDYKTAWQKLEELAKEINKTWKGKKRALELLREARK